MLTNVKKAINKTISTSIPFAFLKCKKIINHKAMVTKSMHLKCLVSGIIQLEEVQILQT